MRPYQMLLIVATLVVSATTGLGLALTQVDQSQAQPQSSRPQPSTKPIADPNSLPTSSPPHPIPMATPTPNTTPVNHPASTEPTSKTTSDDSSPRQPLALSDAVEPGTEFYQFREQLRQAVNARDIDFVSQLIPEIGVSIGFSVPSSVDELELVNPDAEIWAIFEKALAQGCEEVSANEYPGVDPGTSAWLCTNVGRTFLDQYPNPDATPGIEYEVSHAIVVGHQVNVRSLPTTASKVIGTLTNEVVALDRQAWERMATAVPEEVWTKRTHPLNGWTPVLLPNNQSGYVKNRYVYQPLAPKLLIGQVNGQWQILRIPAGD